MFLINTKYNKRNIFFVFNKLFVSLYGKGPKLIILWKYAIINMYKAFLQNKNYLQKGGGENAYLPAGNFDPDPPDHCQDSAWNHYGHRYHGGRDYACP